MIYSTRIKNRPFQAIKSKTKTVEGRALTSWETIPLTKLKVNDSIVFTNNTTSEELIVRVFFIHHYPSVKEMLETEEVENVLSSNPKTIENGINGYHSISEYKESIEKNGIFAIGIKLV